ncbi:DoxX family protein [Methylomonas sp. MS20]|uniref:DoxX family protein n=1 Tax=Methylomonas sp. MS20 TaxID=3418769 RepID=UPI003D04CF37
MHSIYFHPTTKTPKPAIFETLTNRTAAASDFALRLWLAHAFWVSGQQKLASWAGTLYLFEYEYRVPLLAPDWAAYLATAVELVLPVCLVLGCYGRVTATLLALFNAAAVLSYPDLGPAGLEQHLAWGLVLLSLAARGPGAWSVDAWRRLTRREAT